MSGDIRIPSNDMLANGRGVTATTTTPTGAAATKGKQRRSTIGNNSSMGDAQATTSTSTPSQINNTVSSIAQRPRRQVKHKFIKSANINLIDKSNEQQNSVQNTNVTEQHQQTPLPPPPPPPSAQQQQQQQQPLESFLQMLSPNSKRLVPVLHRLPQNTAKLNWSDVISQIPEPVDVTTETVCATTSTAMTPFENCDSSAKDPSDGANNNDNGSNSINENGAILTHTPSESVTSSVNKEMKTERHKKMSNTKQAIRRGRQLRQTVCPVKPAESDHADDEMVSNEQIVQDSNDTYSGLTSGK